MEPYIPEVDSIKYVAAHLQNMETLTIGRANISTSLTRIAYNSDSTLANMTANATVHTSQLENGTTITCRTFRGARKSDSHSTLYIAGKNYSSSVCSIVIKFTASMLQILLTGRS